MPHQAQARYVLDRVLANRKAGISLADQAVLFRVGSHSADIEAECRRRKVDFIKFGGKAFLGKKHVRHVLAALAWAENPRDQTSAQHLIEAMPGIGSATAGRFLASIEGTKIITALREFKPPVSATEAWSDLRDLMRKLRKRDAPWLDQIKAVRRWMVAQVERLYDNPDACARDIDTLLGVAATFECRQEFLANFALNPHAENAGGSAETDRLVLSTLHAVKGREFEAVFVLNAIDGALPIAGAVRDPDLVAEERRLLYVAMTRAKRLLILLMPQTSAHVQPTVRPLGNRPPVVGRTRFIPNAMLDLFDQQDLSRST